jgi:hypothetical protein
MLSAGGMDPILKSRPTDTAFRSTQLAVLDIGDVFWEPSIVNAFENADVKCSMPPPDLDACFEKDTVLADKLLDRLKHGSEANRTQFVSLPASENWSSSSGVSRFLLFLLSVECLAFLTSPPDSTMYNEATIRHGVDFVTIGHWLISKRAPRFTQFRRLMWWWVIRFCKLMDAKKCGIRIKRRSFGRTETGGSTNNRRQAGGQPQQWNIQAWQHRALFLHPRCSTQRRVRIPQRRGGRCQVPTAGLP